jgi:hypothetical protein
MSLSRAFKFLASLCNPTYIKMAVIGLGMVLSGIYLSSFKEIRSQEIVIETTKPKEIKKDAK